MKIKIIDLLNKIANGEELPNKIKHWKTEYQKLDDDTFVQYRNKDGYCLDLVQILNDEVEIIEEDKPIEELKTEIVDTERKLIGTSGTKYSIRVVDNILINKINELVREINKLKKTINKIMGTDKPIETENEIENLEELGIKIGQMYKELTRGIIKGFEEEKNQ